jgi:hypothetical protein
MAYNRFSIQILAYADSTDQMDLHKSILDALKTVDRFKVKAVNLDMWAEPYSGRVREFDALGNEIPKEETPAAAPEVELEG